MIDVALAVVAWLALVWLARHMDKLERAQRARDGRAPIDDDTGDFVGGDW